MHRNVWMADLAIWCAALGERHETNRDEEFAAELVGIVEAL